MKKLYIPNCGEILIRNILFDVNGTIQFSGSISKDLIPKFQKIKEIYDVYLISADTRGNLEELANQLQVKYIRINPKEISESQAKNYQLDKLGKNETIAVGNGNNDSLMLKNALLGILIIGNEGATRESLFNSDLVFTNPIDVLDFLIDEKAIIGTLRK
ncbi:MAG: hypothetical protein BAJALOKI3v1_120028 [Promethearchaeota archaeon]|jgi:soluble P-type ATPase|nr:MAG: hypothetical protein BAJALOKI3v1_120028 [Candidatus Lokiarchaeota archaeon]